MHLPRQAISCHCKYRGTGLSSEYHYYGGRAMDKTISASDASRRFSELLRAVRAGESYVVTAHGKPIARLVPFSGNEDAQSPARAALLERLMAEPVTHAGHWSRDGL